MIKLHILGSASGVPTKKRFCESMAISVKDGLYLFDCGERGRKLPLKLFVAYDGLKMEL